jgi:hypothetical protein
VIRNLKLANHFVAARRFRTAGILVLAFPALTCAMALLMAWQRRLFVPSLLPLLVWPIGMTFFGLFMVSGIGLLRQRRWAAPVAVVTLALIVIVEWGTCLVTLTPRDWLSFSELPALGWVVAAIACFGAMGVLLGRPWMRTAAALALLILAIAVWAIALGWAVADSGGRRWGGPIVPENRGVAAVRALIAVLSNSLLLAYPVVVLIALTRWRLLDDEERAKNAS